MYCVFLFPGHPVYKGRIPLNFFERRETHTRVGLKGSAVPWGTPMVYSSFTLTWLMTNDFQVEFFSFNYQKQWKLSVCKTVINQVRVNGLYFAPLSTWQSYFVQRLYIYSKKNILIEESHVIECISTLKQFQIVL